MRMALAEKHKETLMIIENLQAKVLDDELIRWKREQQLAGNGVPFHSNLDSIQVSWIIPTSDYIIDILKRLSRYWLH